MNARLPHPLPCRAFPSIRKPDRSQKCAASYLPGKGKTGSVPNPPVDHNARATGYRPVVIRCARYPIHRVHPNLPLDHVVSARRHEWRRHLDPGQPHLLKAPSQGCRRARCRYPYRPCWSQSLPHRVFRPARLFGPPGRAVSRSTPRE